MKTKILLFVLLVVVMFAFATPAYANGNRCGQLNVESKHCFTVLAPHIKCFDYGQVILCFIEKPK